jgi:hypothetical protein
MSILQNSTGTEILGSNLYSVGRDLNNHFHGSGPGAKRLYFHGFKLNVLETYVRSQ